MSDPPPPAKRSRWEEQQDDDDELELRAAEARARAAAKASRERVKAMNREKQRKEQREQEQQQQQQHNQPLSSAASHPHSPFASQEAGPSRVASTSAASLSPTAANRRRRRPPRPGSAMPPRSAYPRLAGCRTVYEYERLNHIEEGSYGVVFRAREKRPGGDVVALKKLKLDRERNGFPITSLREIRTILASRHENVVRVREIVVGDTLTQIFIVMDFIEHDLKTLLTTMRTPFLASEIKTLLQQLLRAMSLLHRNWIIHRDLKTSNLLMNNRGQIKLADFGLARYYGEPRGPMTDLVVTLWYRAPELLLGAPSYDTAIDMWSVGCIFAELMLREPLFPGKNEADQISKIFKLLGHPSAATWPEYPKLPGARHLPGASPSSHRASAAASSSSPPAHPPSSVLRQKFRYTTECTLDLLAKLLRYDPEARITADEALRHPYFRESPLPAHPDTFGSFPSVAAGERRRSSGGGAGRSGGGHAGGAAVLVSPHAPERLADTKLAYQLELDLP